MSGHGQCSLSGTRSSDHRGAQEDKHARRRDICRNKHRRACRTVPARILLFAQASMRSYGTAKTMFYFMSDTDISETRKSNSSRARKTEVQGKEDWVEKKLGPGSSHLPRTYRLFAIAGTHIATKTRKDNWKQFSVT